MAGIEVSRETINRRVGSVAAQLFSSFAEVKKIKSWLDGVTAGDLETVHGFTAEDAAAIKSAYADLAELAAVWDGTRTVPLVKDYRTFARRLTGVGQY
ncbi:hypothetical protein [Prauserella endophytica]|uniref:Integrase n=1 Tax=Prauserella endophytica TaxID=1592324 RepID=A0ABY2RSR5_9PSEU|nr:hypothetical protein [Prauserella endophytica]TKG58883.1 hypothetical protein FCN18_37340 [Prauserella endophytica]